MIDNQTIQGRDPLDEAILCILNSDKVKKQFQDAVERIWANMSEEEKDQIKKNFFN